MKRNKRILGVFFLLWAICGAAPGQTLTGIPGVLQWGAQNTAIGHLIGFGASGGLWQVNLPGSTNWLSYGPYTVISTPGDYVAAWSLASPFNTGVNPAVATIDVNDATTQTELAFRQPLQSEFPPICTGPGCPNPFATLFVPFTIDSTRAGHQFEFRVLWLAQSSMLEQVLGYIPLQWNAQNSALGHLIGRPDTGGWSASVTDGPGWLQYGPYTTLSSAGNYVALWTLRVDNNTADNNTVAVIDINDATTQTQLNFFAITRKQFLAASKDQVFQFPFSIDSSRAGHQFEFRVNYTAASYVREQAVGVVQTP